MIIDLKQDRIIICSSKNIRVVYENLKSETSQQVRRKREKQPPTPSEAGKPKILNREFKEELKKEVYDILNRYPMGLTLDDILEVAQYEKNSYSALNKLIRLAGSAYSAKRYLALVVGALRKEGRIIKKEERVNDESKAKYYVSSKNVKWW